MSTVDSLTSELGGEDSFNIPWLDGINATGEEKLLLKCVPRICNDIEKKKEDLLLSCIVKGFEQEVKPLWPF